MSKYLERAEKLRAIVEPHYNCAQSVLMSFSPDFNLSDKAAYNLAVHFGAGMKSGNVCGAVTGALMALGLAGKSDEKLAHQVLAKFKENHQGCLNCVDLLRQNKEAGGNKKAHCDACVYECVKLVEELL